MVDEELEDALRALGYTGDAETDTTVGFEAYGGYRLHPHFALEAQFELLSEADLDVEVGQREGVPSHRPGSAVRPGWCRSDGS